MPSSSPISMILLISSSVKDTSAFFRFIPINFAIELARKVKTATNGFNSFEKKLIQRTVKKVIVSG